MFAKIFGRKPPRVRRSAILGVCMVLVLGACAAEDGAEPEDGDVRQVHFILEWIPGGDHAPLFVALERGFWLDEGLAVTVSPGFGSGDTVVRVGTGEGEFGIAGVPDMMQAMGEGVPLVRIGQIPYHIDAEAAFVDPEAPYAEPADLLNLRGAISPDEDPSDTYLGVFLETEEGIDVNDIEFARIERAGIAQVEAGQADFVFTFISAVQEWWLQDPPVEPHVLWYGAELDVYGNGLITRPELLENDPDLVERFVRGAVRGYQYVIEGGLAAQQEAIDLLFKFHPDLREQPNAEEFNLARLQIMLATMMGEDVEEHGLGYILPEKAERTVQILNELVMDEALPVEQVFAGDNQPLESQEFMIEDIEEARASVGQVLGRPNPVLEALAR